MPKILVEFINTCPCCDAHARTVEEVAAQYPDTFEVRIYRAGKDVGYLRKYGMITKGTLIVDGRTRIDVLSREAIAEVLARAAKEGRAP